MTANDSHEWAMALRGGDYGHDDRPEPYEYEGGPDIPLPPSPNACRLCGWVRPACQCGGGS